MSTNNFLGSQLSRQVLIKTKMISYQILEEFNEKILER